MTYRWLAVAAAVLTGVYAIVYVSVVRSQQGDVAWWYVGALVVAIVALGIAVAGGPPRATLVVATVVLGLSTVVGLLSVGLLLIPAVLAAGAALLVVAIRPRVPAGALPSPRSGRGTNTPR